jgi:ABC-type lipoprotein release transport system permease subunit
VLLGLIGLVVGAALGAAITLGIGSIDISSFGEMDFMGVQMPTEIFLSIDPLALTAPSVTMLVTCLIGGFWPAYKASRLRPADAVRHV